MLSYDHILAARQRLAGGICRTPSEHSVTLSRMLGADLFIKCENMQFTASFKERGALNKLLTLLETGRPAGVVAMSAGNHAKAVAYHAGRLGIPACIVMPLATPIVKVTDTQALGAEVLLQGDTLAEAAEHAAQLATARGFTLIHPYDDVEVMAGQGTVALEFLEDCPELDTLVVPIGGGGLVSGVALAAKTLRPSLRIVGVQSAAWPAVRQQLDGQPLQVGGATIAEGIAVKYPGAQGLALIRQYVDEVLLVSEEALERAVSLYVNIEKIVAEGAGAASLAAVIEHPQKFAGRRVGVILSGANIDAKILAFILLRDLVHSGRLVRIRVIIDDRPGALSQVTALVGQLDGNILDVEHQRVFSRAAVRETVMVVSVEVRYPGHGEEICKALQQAGLRASIVPL